MKVQGSIFYCEYPEKRIKRLGCVCPQCGCHFSLPPDFTETECDSCEITLEIELIDKGMP